MISNKLISIVLFLLTSSNALSQFAGFINYSKKNGLPDDNVTCMLTDKQGFVWMGTFNGLSRFDGTHFYNLPQGTIDSKKLAGDIILDLQEDGDFIWVAHRFGLSRVNKYSFECENFQNREPGQLYSLRRAIRDIYMDNTGVLWLAGDHQLLKFEKKSNSIIIVADFEKIFPHKSASQVNKIIKGEDGFIWLFIVKNWYRFDIGKNKFDTAEIKSIPIHLLKGENLRLRSYWNTFVSNFYVQYNPAGKSLSVTNTDSAGAAGKALNIYVDSSLQVIICQEQNGISIFNKNVSNAGTGSSDFLAQYNLQPFNFINYSNGIFCRGTVKGLYVSDNRNRYLHEYNFSQQAAALTNPVPDILDVKEYNETEWLVSTKNGLYSMNRLTGQIKEMEAWNDSAIYKVLVMPDKTIWLSTDIYLWHYNPHNGKKEKPIRIETYAMTLLRHQNKIIAGTRSDGIVIVDTKNKTVTRLKYESSKYKLSGNRITSIKAIDNAGNFIITYNNLAGYYSYLHVDSGMYKTDSIPSAAYHLKERFSLHTVHSGKGQLWLGNYLGGVHLYDSASKSWTNFTMNTGLSNNSTYEILGDASGKTWILTESGIDVYDKSRQRIYNFPVRFLTGGKKGGFIHSSGKLIFFDKATIVEINPAIFSVTPLQRNILLSQIKQGDKLYAPEQPFLKLAYNNNSFTINFSLQKPDADYQANYAYRLSDKENWKEIGTETQLNFAALQPGNYKLQIKATDEFGQWSYYSQPFSITIKPPFWQTWWFLLAVLACSFLVLRYIITRRQQRRIKQLQQQNEIMRLNAEKETSIAKERERIITDLHDDVGATLSSLSIYGELANNVWTDKPEESRKLIDKISVTAKALMGRMGDIIWSMRAGDEEKFTLEARLKNYCNELLSPKNIESHVAIDNKLAATISNPGVKKNILLIAKEAINNIAKYSDATVANIVFEKQEAGVALIISDNGNGFGREGSRQGNGLHNMEARCKALQGNFSIQTAPRAGTVVTCLFPIATISYTN